MAFLVKNKNSVITMGSQFQTQAKWPKFHKKADTHTKIQQSKKQIHRNLSNGYT